MLTLYCKGRTSKALGVIILWMIIEVENEAATREFAQKLGRVLKGAEIIELVGDVGAGKTTFVKGMALGLDIDEDVQSPSFTINSLYDARDGLHLAHYDFYRLAEAGIMSDDLAENMQDPATITVIEWADIVEGTLPEHRLTINFETPTETTRRLTLTGRDDLVAQL